MDIGSGRTTDAICRYVRYTRACIYDIPPLFLYLPVSPSWSSHSLTARNSLFPLEPQNHVSCPQLLLFPKLFSSSTVRPRPFRLTKRIVRDKSSHRWPSDLLTQFGPAPENSLDQTQSFPFEWHARTSKLWLPNHRRYALPVWLDTAVQTLV